VTLEERLLRGEQFGQCDPSRRQDFKVPGCANPGGEVRTDPGRALQVHTDRSETFTGSRRHDDITKAVTDRTDKIPGPAYQAILVAWRIDIKARGHADEMPGPDELIAPGRMRYPPKYPLTFIREALVQGGLPDHDATRQPKDSRRASNDFEIMGQLGNSDTSG
jgi:hypothetical protein